MGVITQKGTIGIVHSVSQNYSVGLSLLHKKSSISVKLKKIVITVYLNGMALIIGQ